MRSSRPVSGERSCHSLRRSIGRRVTPAPTLRLQLRHGLIRIPAERPGSDGSLDHILDAAASFRRFQRRFRGPVWPSHRDGKTAPHIRRGYHDLVVWPCTLEAAVRHELRMPVAVSCRRHTAERVHGDPWRRKRHHAFDLRQLDELSCSVLQAWIRATRTAAQPFNPPTGSPKAPWLMTGDRRGFRSRSSRLSPVRESSRRPGNRD